jgi:hypothetical protein
MHASPPHTVAAASGWVVTLLVLACLLPPPANAKSLTIKGHELTLDITNTFVYTYRFDNDRASDYSGLVGPRLSQQILNDNIDDLYHQFFNTLDISLSHADFRLGARFDLNLFANTPFDQFSGNCAGNLSPRPSWCSQANDRYKNSFVPERVYFVVAKPEFDLTLGDFYVSFGRGLALNVVKQDELGQDTAVRGGKFALHHGALQLVFFGGEFNFLDLDTQTGWDAPWRAEPVLGGRFEYTLFEELIFGVHGVYLIRDDHSKTGFSASSEPRTDYEAVVGGGDRGARPVQWASQPRCRVRRPEHAQLGRVDSGAGRRGERLRRLRQRGAANPGADRARRGEVLRRLPAQGARH